MSGSAEILKLDTRTMRQVARTIENQLSILRSSLGSIRDDANALRGGDWEGDSATAYFESMSKLCNEQTVEGALSAGGVAQTLRGYVSHLNNAAAAFDKNENKQIDRMESLKTDIFSV